MMFPKPEKKQKQPYQGLRPKSNKPKKEIAPWRENILSSHQSTPSTKDRGEFPRKVIEELIVEAGGKCQSCLKNPDTTTHHVVPRAPARGGRGVKSNGLRLCWPCHDRIQTDMDELNYWIEIYRVKYGENFWFDAEDWEQYNRKQAATRTAEDEEKQRMDRINPVVELLTVSTGRKLKIAEIRLIDGMDDREVAIFTKLMADVVAAGIDPIKPKGTQGYGHYFED